MDNLTPEQKADLVYESGELILNPYDSGTLEYKRFIDRLLERTSEDSNGN